ncbi:hypothetical protein TPChic_0217a [Treponema pallidum subsp. pallidum str. Chicago]|nr:hypothetical protein TPChic_0217a [Treponema pallidum subsp. pallidum str. Chicago]
MAASKTRCLLNCGKKTQIAHAPITMKPTHPATHEKETPRTRE